MRNRTRFVGVGTTLVASAAVVLAAACGEETPRVPSVVTEERFELLDAALSARAGERRFAGVVAVARDGVILHMAAYGEASLELGVPHTVDTRFKLHSLSKPMLAAVLLRSVDIGKVDLDGPIATYLSAWPQPWSEVVVRDLATHTSGIPDFAGSFLSGWSGSALSTWKAIASEFADSDLSFEPGTDWAYSNAGYVLLAALLEAVWEMPLAAILTEQLTGPAGLESTQLEVTPPWDSISYDGHQVLPRLASGYNGSPEAPQVANSKMYAIPGAGGIVTTAGNLVDFSHALFEGNLLAPATLAAATTLAPGQSEPYALGWVVADREGLKVYRHDGGNNGFVSSLEYYPDLKLTIVLLCNLGYVPMAELRDEVAALVLPRGQ